jgi:hypothetical protein
MNKWKKKRILLLCLATLLALISVILATSFQFVDNHRWYWNTAHVICGLGVLSATSAGFLAGRNLIWDRKRRIWLVFIGAIPLVAWIMGSILAVVLEYAAMNYFSNDMILINWNSYQGDYVVGLYHIRSLQLAVTAGLLGGFLSGFGLAPANIDRLQ